MSNSLPHAMNLPWCIIEDERRPFDIRIVDDTGAVVFDERREAWSSKWMTVADCTDERNDPAMVTANRRQLFRLEFIIAAANKTA